MTAYYFDTSALIKRFARETGTAFVLNLFRNKLGNFFYTTQLTEVKVFAALSKRQKGLNLTASQVSKAQTRFLREYEDHFFK